MNSTSKPIEIILKTDIEDLRDLYFGNRDHIYFFGPKTQGVSWSLTICLILFPILTWYSFHSQENQIIFVFASVALLIAIGVFWEAVGPIIQWKKTVSAFLKDAENIRNLRVLYTDDFIIHIQDNQEIKLRWELVNHAFISDRSITLNSDTTSILLPKSAMKPEEYMLLSNKIMHCVREVQKTGSASIQPS